MTVSDLVFADQILDFEDGVDVLGLAGGLTFADLTISDGGTADTAITHTASGEILVTLVGVDDSNIGTGDFMLV